MDQFKALVVKESDDNIVHGIEEITLDQLDEGNVLIKVAYSSLNYKDMLAVQPKGGVIRRYPMIPGIDLSGTVVTSEDDRFTEGQEVLITGYDLGVSHTGGLSEYARVNADWIIPLPEGLSLKDAMVYGTAGFTAAQSVYALEQHGLADNKDARVIITGATGGVGSVALQLLSKAGYTNLTALVRKDYQVEVAKNLGAHHIVFPDDLGDKRMLSRASYDFALDTVGGDVAATIIPQLADNGGISMCGNAAGVKLETNVLPFILRGVNILGINSVTETNERRLLLWDHLATDWNISLDALSNEITLDEVPSVLAKIKDGQHLGRTIVKF